MKYIGESLHGKDERMIRVLLNKFGKQHSAKQ